MNNSFAATPHSTTTTGEVMRMLREPKGWTQAELARRCRISATNLNLLENEKVEIGTIIMFPEYEGKEKE